MDRRRLRVGIAGCGVVGRRRRAILEAHDAFTVTHLCDVAFAGERRDAASPARCAELSELLRQPLDALFVALPNHLAAAATIAGLERGLHVFCEKPPARTPAELARVVRCEQEHPGQQLMYGFNHRYHASVRAALELVRSGELGSLIDIRGVYGKSHVQVEGGWRGQRALAGGGILLDQGIHMLDLLRLFAGELDEVRSFVADRHWHHDVEDNAYALLRSSSGVVAMLHSSATQWRHLFRLELSLARGALALEGITSGSSSYGPETLTVVRRGPGGALEQQARQFEGDGSWAAEIDAFAAAIATGRPPRWGTSADAMRTLELVQRVYEAAPPDVIDPIGTRAEQASPRQFAAAHLARSARTIEGIDPQQLAGFIEVLDAARRRGATIFFLGNGGSAATAAHFVNDLCYGPSPSQPQFRALCLSDNTPGLTAIANDHGYHEVFVRPLQVHLRQGDVVVALSASGCSENVLAAVAHANAQGAVTVALTGFDGGRLRSLVHHGVHVPTAHGEYGPVEDAHLVIGHLVTSYFANQPRLLASPP